jgi:PKD repeat protein
MSSSSNLRTIMGALCVMMLTLTLLSLSPSSAAAQGHWGPDYCAQHTATLLDTTDNCTNEPWRPRASEVQTFSWEGHDYMIFNTGNELDLYQVDDPANPVDVGGSSFRFDTLGDSDYDLGDFDVCNDCRYGVLSHKVEGTVVFDLGVGAVPSFGAYATYLNAPSAPGGFVFSKGGQQYMIAEGLPGSNCAGSGIYMLNGLDQIDVLQCGEVGGAGVEVRGLQAISDRSWVLYLYLSQRNGQTHVFRADGSGAGLTLVYVTSPAGMFGRNDELSIDVASTPNRAASADYFGRVVNIWDLSVPASPVFRYSIPVQATTLSLRKSTLFTMVDGRPDSTQVFAVEDTGYETVEDENFWYDNTLPHNPDVGCAFEASGALSQDGSALYLSRYAIHQAFDLTDCLTPTPAIADLVITPGGESPTPPVFPGESIEVFDRSSGVIDEWALWITKNGLLVEGNDVLNTTNDRILNYTIPQDVQATDTFIAHVEVDSSKLTPAEPYFELPVNIDREPTASFKIEPSAVIVRETVTLTASADGIVGTDGYQWEITGPGVTDTRSGQVVEDYELTASGDWWFKLTVHYDHGASGVVEEVITPDEEYVRYGDLEDSPDGKYEYERRRKQSVSSVAADFFWSPSSPLHTQPIALDGSLSKPSSGLKYRWEVKLGEISVFSCPESADDECVIPAETLSPGTYEVTLWVKNSGGDEDSETKDMDVYNVDPTISWSPSNPEIGEDIVFTIEGVPGGFDSASWNMGGAGCDGADSTPTCDNPSFLNSYCRYQSYAYNSSGTKTVTLSVVVDNNTFTAPPVQVPVQATGSCNTPPPAQGTYSISPSSVEFGPAGGETAVTVDTQSGCSWSASTIYPWITVVSPTASFAGRGTLRFRASANTGPYRTGSIVAGGKGLVVNQQPPNIPANFTMSTGRPEIGQVVTFSVDPILEVASWDFGEANCRQIENNPENTGIDCYFQSGNACNTSQWTFPSSGEKTVTMVLTDGRTKTKYPIVANKGECCLADGRPDADFTMSAEQAYTGETITFTDLSQKSAVAKALTFSWSPQNPEIGEIVRFRLEGLAGDIERATWDFGEDGCDGLAAVQECVPRWGNTCEFFSFIFASADDKMVTVTVELEGGGTETAGPRVVTVANAGECPSGGSGGPVCSYSVSPINANFAAGGGSGSFNVTTTEECEWSPITYAPWIHIDAGGGFGSGTVEYSVDANTGSSNRDNTIFVEGKTHRVYQDGDRGNTAPTEWRWTITRVVNEEGETVDEDYYSSTDQHTSYRFTDAGRYRVTLTAINCYEDSSTHRYVDILEAPVANFVVASAISSSGANNTRWESDFRFFNPCDEVLDVSLVYQPDNQDNTLKQLSTYPFVLGPGETMFFPNAREVVNADDGETINGSILIDSVSESGCKVLSVSRTFNDTPDGTLGLFVPTMPVTSVGVKTLNLTGLISNNEYRSNLRLVNHGDAEAWVRITLFDKNGRVLNGEGKSVKVMAHSTKQINEVAPWAGVEASLSQFTVLAEVRTEGANVDGFGTVTDNISGDSVMSGSSYLDEPVVWLPGVVYAPGRNDTFWQTDVWIHNPVADDQWLTSQATYVDGGDTSLEHLFWDDWPAVESLGMRRRLNIAGGILDDLGVDSTSGYLIFEGLGGDNAPQIAARTFTSDESGGTFGLHLPSYGPSDVLRAGEIGYIVGVSNSADDLSGYRTNLGLLATGRTVEVEVTFFYPDGTPAPELWTTTVWAGQLKQVNNVFRKFGLGGETVTGTFKLEVLSGDDLIIYATETDNKTGDSIFIPAQMKYVNPAE